MNVFRRIFASVLEPVRKRIARERFLLPNEWDAIRPILDRHPLKVFVYFLFLLLTGARMSEARTMKWSELDLLTNVWHKSRTKNGKRQILALCPQACELLRRLPREGVYVFSGDVLKGGDPNKPWSRTAVRYWWRKIRAEADCEDVQIRDLRRTFATWLASDGVNLVIIKEILNHSSVATTQIYARADQRTVKAALTRAADRVLVKT